MILRLLASLTEVQDVQEMNGVEEVKETDKVVGTLGPLARALATVIDRKSELSKAKLEEADLLILDLTFRRRALPEDAGKVIKIVEKLEKDREIAILLRKLFWQEVREEIGEAGEDPHLVIRKGGLIVSEKCDCSNVNPSDGILADILARIRPTSRKSAGATSSD
jgi:hypothetical protein